MTEPVQVDVAFKDRCNGVSIVVCNVRCSLSRPVQSTLTVWMPVDKVTKVIWDGNAVDFDSADPIHAAIQQALETL